MYLDTKVAVHLVQEHTLTRPNVYVRFKFLHEILCEDILLKQVKPG